MVFTLIMPGLEDIREKLYRKNFEEASPPRRGRLPLRKKDQPVKRSWSSAPPESLLIQAGRAAVRQRRVSTSTLLTLAAVVAVLLGAVIGYAILFAPAAVEFVILGPSQVTAGEPAVFTLRITNRSRVTLTEGAVSLAFPEGTVVLDQALAPLGALREKVEIPDISAGGAFQKEIRAKLLGAVGQQRLVSGLYVYRPENIASKLTRRAEVVATILRVPLVLTFGAPERVSSGQEVSLTVSVDAEASAPFPDMSLGVDFPAGFEYTDADPPPAGGSKNLWRLGDLDPGTSRRITIRGRLTGEPEEGKPFRIRLGRHDPSTDTWLVLAEHTGVAAIASPFLYVQTTLNGERGGNIAPGAGLGGAILFKNNLPEKIQNLIVTLNFPEMFVQLETVRVEQGFYDVTRRAVVWNPASDPRLRELDPGEEGMLTFSFTTKPNLPIRSASEKHFRFPVRTTIDSASPPPAYRSVLLAYEDLAEFKFDSRLALAVRSAYYDSPTPNSGPLPPTVRQTTTYAIWLQLSSGANDHRDIEVRAQLPGGVEWRGELRVDAGAVEFNPARQELIWRIRELPAATGILRPQTTAIVMVALTPAENQVGSAPLLLTDIAASGIDAFTASRHTATGESATTELDADPQSKPEEWTVVPMKDEI